MTIFSKIINKEFAASGPDNYMPFCTDEEKQCQNCVCFGCFNRGLPWKCVKDYPIKIKQVERYSHCDKFSNTKKINKLKYWLLKIDGFQFKNKAR